MNVIVLGDGIIGVTTAYYLARTGHEVTVVDRREDVALETSFANGGLVTPSQAAPWNEPGIARKLLKWLGRDDAPFVMRPRAALRTAPWALAFIRNTVSARYRRNTATVLRLALYSVRVLRALRDEIELDYDQTLTGSMKVFRERADLEHAVEFSTFLGRCGVAHRVLDRDGALELEPALAPVGEHLVGAIHYPEDEGGDAYKFTRAIAEAARRQGATFLFNTTVERLETARGRIAAAETSAGRLEGDAFVLALGSYGPALVRPLGIRLPVAPVKGYSLTAPRGGWNDAPRNPVADESLKTIVAIYGDRVRIAGSAEIAGYDAQVSERRAAYIWNSAVRMFPALERHVGRESAVAWTGLRPMTPDGAPILGPTGFKNLFLNIGHGHLGWTLAAGSARVGADLVSGRVPAIDLQGLEPARFQ